MTTASSGELRWWSPSLELTPIPTERAILVESGRYVLGYTLHMPSTDVMLPRMHYIAIGDVPLLSTKS